MPEKCDCEACQTAARRMNYITQLIDWTFPHIFTAHSKIIVHFDNDDPNEIEIEEGHPAQEDLLRIFRMVENMHILTREIRTINRNHNGSG
jgi:hypothetical protein